MDDIDGFRYMMVYIIIIFLIVEINENQNMKVF
jgi:hypothetical protein